MLDVWCVDKHTLSQRNEFWFLDYSLIPLYIQQLYMASVSNGHRGSRDLIKVLAEAANGVSESDLGLVDC